MSFDYAASALSSRGRGMLLLNASDPVGYSKPKPRRWDAKFGAIAIWNEVLSLVERASIFERVRVKNTTGGTLAKGTLVYLDTLKLTAQTQATAVNDPLAGGNAVINVAATFEVGQLITVESGGKVDVAFAAAASAGASVTADQLNNNHIAPLVTALPAYEVSLADADGSKIAEWVLADDIANGAYGDAYACVEVTGLDTSLLTIEQLLYLSATAGAYTVTAPTGADQFQQVVGVVKTVHATSGAILFFPGAKRILKYGSSFLQGGAAAPGFADKTATYTVLASENGKTFRDSGAAGAASARAITMPITAGQRNLYIGKSGNGLRIVPASGAVKFGSMSAANFEITDYGTVELVGDGTDLIVISQSGNQSSF